MHTYMYRYIHFLQGSSILGRRQAPAHLDAVSKRLLQTGSLHVHIGTKLVLNTMSLSIDTRERKAKEKEREREKEKREKRGERHDSNKSKTRSEAARTKGRQTKKE